MEELMVVSHLPGLRGPVEHRNLGKPRECPTNLMTIHDPKLIIHFLHQHEEFWKFVYHRKRSMRERER